MTLLEVYYHWYLFTWAEFLGCLGHCYILMVPASFVIVATVGANVYLLP